MLALLRPLLEPRYDERDGSVESATKAIKKYISNNNDDKPIYLD
jgi:hypothetical protein